MLHYYDSIDKLKAFYRSGLELPKMTWNNASTCLTKQPMMHITANNVAYDNKSHNVWAHTL